MFIDYVVVAMVILGAIITIKGFIKPERIRFFESVVERDNVLVGV